jgi:hypothetical protein
VDSGHAAVFTGLEERISGAPRGAAHPRLEQNSFEQNINASTFYASKYYTIGRRMRLTKFIIQADQ